MVSYFILLFNNRKKTMNLKDKIAIVTGASRGLGKTIACELAARGAHVFIVSQSKPDIEAACSEIEAKGCTCSAYTLDVTEENKVARFINKVIKTHKRIDILVNNAGWTTTRKNLEDISDEEYRKTMAINVDAVFYFLKSVLPIMKSQENGARGDSRHTPQASLRSWASLSRSPGNWREAASHALQFAPRASIPKCATTSSAKKTPRASKAPKLSRVSLPM
jgi:NAD(P)-dependent dehydrogenase (short-subunit alcohol dehydrogenase family)